MNQPSDHTWEPDPQTLAAYFDGELDGRDELGDMRARIEAWLVTHPDAAEESDALQKLWLDTTPAEPSAQTWNAVLNRIEAQGRRPITVSSSRRPWLIAGIVAASVVLFVGVLFGPMRSLFSVQPNVGSVAINPAPPMPDEFEVLPVALASEVTILRIEGADTDAVVVGTMPVDGPLELVASGEVCISCKCPRVNVRQDPPHRPMVWARVDAE